MDLIIAEYPMEGTGRTVFDQPPSFVRFVQEYAKEGISMDAIHVQNEPNSDQKFPSCLWTGEQMRDFIRDYLGPIFERERLDCRICIQCHGLQETGWSYRLCHPEPF